MSSAEKDRWQNVQDQLNRIEALLKAWADSLNQKPNPELAKYDEMQKKEKEKP